MTNSPGSFVTSTGILYYINGVLYKLLITKTDVEQPKSHNKSKNIKYDRDLPVENTS